jgi:hypothetical protein
MFKIIVVWELDFVEVMKMSKILNKDCNMSMKSSYCESLTHVHQIWISYDKLTLNLDNSLSQPHFGQVWG